MREDEYLLLQRIQMCSCQITIYQLLKETNNVFYFKKEDETIHGMRTNFNKFNGQQECRNHFSIFKEQSLFICNCIWSVFKAGLFFVLREQSEICLIPYAGLLLFSVQHDQLHFHILLYSEEKEEELLKQAQV